jgi:hypothetical protein
MLILARVRAPSFLLTYLTRSHSKLSIASPLLHDYPFLTISRTQQPMLLPVLELLKTASSLPDWLA